MKQIHIHVGVEDITQAVTFYSALFDAVPTKQKPDYAKWLLSDPRLNFAISTGMAGKGVNHLGIQVEDEHELTGMRARLGSAEMTTFDEGETDCCYARSDKSWVTDPAGMNWEVYQTTADGEVMTPDQPANDGSDPCCTPETKGQPGCCAPSEKTAGCCA